MDALNWPLIAVITYSFLLALIIVGLILRSRRNEKSRYANMLDEKETKLARLQLDIEETMESLDLYANQLREDWSKLRSDDHEVIHKLHKREIDLETAVSALKVRVAALEVQLKSAAVRTGGEPAVQEKNDMPIYTENDDIEDVDGLKYRQIARSMYDNGAELSEIAKSFGMSVYEIELLIANSPK